MPTRGDRHLSAVQRAKQLAALGARLRTIQFVTGIPPRQAQRLFFPDAKVIPRGRAPDSAEWYHGANLILRADACIVGAKYHQLRRQGLHTADALILAYQAYCAVTTAPHRISMDRAFNLVSHLEGIWLARSPSLSLLTCPDCGCGFLAAMGTVVRPGELCPFCKLVQRVQVDHRVQASYPERPAPDVTQLQLDMLSRFHVLHAEAKADTPAE